MNNPSVEEAIPLIKEKLATKHDISREKIRLKSINEVSPDEASGKDMVENTKHLFVFEDSSLLEYIVYNSNTKILTVGFNNGQKYDYYEVPRGVFDEFMGANSAGKYYNRCIKGVYDSQKLTK